MENFQNFKSSYKEKKAQNDLEEEIILNKLSLRKKKLYEILLQKRLNFISQNSEKDENCQLKEVSILIHKETFDDIQKGLHILYEFLINVNKLEKPHIKYIYENIYYRLLDIINSEKIFDDKGNMSKIFFLINYLTTENNIFIEPITENIFLSNLKKIIELNIDKELFINMIIPVLSDMLINKKKFSQIMKEIDIVKLMKIKIGQNWTNKESIEQLLILMNNFIINIKENKAHKYQFILEYTLNLIKSDINNFFNDEDKSLFLLSLFDILIYMANDSENMKLIKESNCLVFIKNVINDYKHNKIVNNYIYLLKCEELLSNILLGTQNFEDKKNIIFFIYSSDILNKNIKEANNLPFINEFIYSISNKNYHLSNAFLNCIISLINNCVEFAELYINDNNFINGLIKLFSEKIPKKMKNSIILFLIKIVECNNIKIYKYLLNFDIIPILVNYLNLKKKPKKEPTKIIIYNILLFIKKCLSIEEENNMNDISNILNKYNYKEIIETLIDNKDESISELSRKIFINYLSESEKEYIPKINVNKKEKEDMIID